MRTGSIIVSALVLTVSLSVCRAEQSVEPQIDALLAKMTLEEKVTLLAGSDMRTYSIRRLGIPSITMADGPVGVRAGHATSLPSSISMAATWDTDMVNKIARVLAKELKAKGKRMSLAPCVNIQRVPLGGRNFESFGEDPYLASRLAVAYIKGLQDQNVIATIKHYACNNQERQRDSIDVIVDERALREIYLPAFEAAVKEGGSWSVMAAYNKVNGYYCTENSHLINDILKKEWGFKGFVVSDWGATHSTVEAANCGLDLEMPRGDFFNADLIEAVKDGRVKESVLDDKVRRILRAMFFAGLFEERAGTADGALNTAEHRRIALQGARESIVLLKNEKNILPLKMREIRSIAVIGPNAAVNRYGGGGSSEVTPFYSVSPLEGLKNGTGGKVAINYALGCRLEGEMPAIPASAFSAVYNGAKVNGLLGEYFDNSGLNGAPVLRRLDKRIDFNWGEGSPGKGIDKDNFSVRWTGKLAVPATDEYELGLTSDDGSRLYIDGRLLIDNWGDHGAATKNAKIKLLAGREYDLRLEYYENWGLAVVKMGWESPARLLDEAVAAAKRSDAAIICAGLSKYFEGEGHDREGLDLPSAQNELIEKVAEVNKNVIVVLNTGAPVLMSGWIDKVPAVIEVWYPGQEGGNAIADVLLGNYNPSGKLPVTFPVKWEDSPAYLNYPGEDGEVRYAEGVFTGYRYFDAKSIKALFPFGFGLSYTAFEYANLEISPKAAAAGDISVNVSFDVRNTGERYGAEIAQLYIRDTQSSLERPVRELKGFRRLELRPGETKRVNMKLDNRSLSFYDEAAKGWVAEPGEFEVLIGSSSQDIRLRGKFILERGIL